MLQITINQQDLNRLKNKVKLIPLAVQNPVFLSSVGTKLAADAKMNIHQASPDGKTSYAILKPSTLAQKTKLGYSSKPLERSGNLKDSISFQASSGQLYLTALKYAKYHQFGTAKMTARPIFSIRDSSKAFIFKKLEQTISTNLSS